MRSARSKWDLFDDMIDGPENPYERQRRSTRLGFDPDVGFAAEDDEDLSDVVGVPGRRRGRPRATTGRRPGRRAGMGWSGRVGLVVILLAGGWIGYHARGSSTSETTVESLPAPRGLVDVPEGYTPVGLVDPDMSPTLKSEGTWALLADADQRLIGGTWAVVACRTAGDGEARKSGAIVTGTMGADFSVDTVDADGVRIVAHTRSDVVSAMALDGWPEHIVTIIASGWDGAPVGVVRDLYELADADGCAAVPAAAAELTGLPLRQERALGAPIVPVGVRVVSAAESEVGWSGGEDDQTITLTTQQPGTGGDDDDLLEFLRPVGGTQAKIDIGATLGWVAVGSDGVRVVVWIDGGLVHTLTVGAGVEADAVTMARSIHTPTDTEWAAIVDAVGS